MSDRQAFVVGQKLVVGEGDSVDEVQTAGAWIASHDVVELEP